MRDGAEAKHFVRWRHNSKCPKGPGYAQWFKPMAREHIARMHMLARVLEAHGLQVDVIEERRPGYIVYEDEYQVVAEPFQETRT